MLRYHIDFPKQKIIQRISGKIHIAGWFFDDETGRPAESIFAKVGRRKIEFSRVNRSDVNKLVKEQAANTAIARTVSNGPALGFETTFQTGNGIKRLRVFALHEGNEVELGQYLIYFNRIEPIEEESQYAESEYEKIATDLELFDASHYLKWNPDIRRANMSPFQHYMQKGWKENHRKSPSPKYDMNKYLRVYRDVAKANINPIKHFIVKGISEGRRLFLTEAYLKENNNEKGISEFEYTDLKKRRGRARHVIYFFNTNADAVIENPSVLHEDYDYKYFGLPGRNSNQHTVWDYAPSPFYIEDTVLLQSFHCLNIDLLVPDYEKKIWITAPNYLSESKLNEIYAYCNKPRSACYCFGAVGDDDSGVLKEALMDDAMVQGGACCPPGEVQVLQPNCIILASGSVPALSQWWGMQIKYGLGFGFPDSILKQYNGRLILEGTFKNEQIAEAAEYNKSAYQTALSLARIPLPLTPYAAAFSTTHVTVIVPVFNALPDVKECLAALETTTYLNYQLLIADDGSAQEVQDWLKSYAAKRKQVHLITTEKNRGYTKNVNNAIQQADSDYFIILNSDTQVFGNWIEKLLIPSLEDPAVGISGALSNAAGWQSVPFLRGDNTIPRHLSVKSVNAHLEDHSHHPYYPASDIVNGFCMCVKKAVFDQIGLFDEASFPKGYGEEDDFCMRARRAGFKNVIATTVYVHHSKSKSFGHATRMELATAGREILDKKYGQQGYKLLTDSIGKNPLINAVREQLRLRFKSHTSKLSPIDEEIAELSCEDRLPEDFCPSVAVHLHLHYIEMAEYFIYYLEKIPFPFDLYLSSNSQLDDSIIARFGTIKNLKRTVSRVYTNRGRDVYPFIDILRKNYSDYDYLLHIHSKKSAHNSRFGAEWLNYMMSHLLYSGNYIKNVLFAMEENQVGLAFPPVIEELFPNYKWGKNREIVYELLGTLGVDRTEFETETLMFPAGNMFWANASALGKLFAHEFRPEDFPAEPIKIDGTLAHAMERALYFIVSDAQYQTMPIRPQDRTDFRNEIEMFQSRSLAVEVVEEQILSHLKEKKPFSLVRIFDGEGAFYKADNWSETKLKERMEYYFGEGSYAKDDALFIRDSIISSMENADLLGIPNLEVVEQLLEFSEIYAQGKIEQLPYLKRRYSASIDCNSAWRILSAFQMVVNALSTEKSFCTKDIHYDLVLSGGLYRILSQVTHVTIISSQDVGPYLEKIFGVSVNHLVIPGRALDNDNFENTNHYPNMYESICARLKANDLSGKLFLVGAGPLGKSYCDLIKEQNGVALDIGAVFDSWINHFTRPEHVGQNSQFNKNLLLTSENVERLSGFKVNPKNEIDETKLPDEKKNRFIRV